MKKGSSIVNTSREIIDEKEVITMLKSGDLFGYATDVLSEELEVANNMITTTLDCPLNILYTPHIGGCTKEAMQTTEVLLAKYYSQY